MAIFWLNLFCSLLVTLYNLGKTRIYSLHEEVSTQGELIIREINLHCKTINIERLSTTNIIVSGVGHIVQT